MSTPRTVTRPLLARGLALALALVTSLSPAGARADGGDPAAVGVALSVLAWMPGAAVGMVADTAVGVHMVVHRGRVPRPWSLTGTIAWGLAAIAWTPVVAVALDSGNFSPGVGSDQAGWIGFASAGAAFTLGSLAFAVYGLAHPTEPLEVNRESSVRPPRVSLSAPMLAPADGGARVLLGGTF